MKENFWVNKLLDYQIIESKDVEVYKYGMECLVLKAITLIICGIIAFLLKKPGEFIIILLSFIMIRRCAGGYHAKTRYGCIMFSCISMFVSLVLCELHLTLVFHIFVLISIDTGLIFIAPIDNEKNRFNDLEKEFFKRKTCKTLLIMNIVCSCLLLLNMTTIYVPLISGLAMSFFFVIMGKMQENNDLNTSI